jgi:hypothetical protein
VTFSAVLDAVDQLKFASVAVQPSGFVSAAGSNFSVSTGAGAGATMTVGSAAYNNASATMTFGGYTGASIISYSGGVATANIGGTAALAARNNCVPAYTARAAGGGTTFTGTTLGQVRIW